MNAKVLSLKELYYSAADMDGTAVFYDWIRAHADRGQRVLNIGAGPGSDRAIKSLRGEVRLVDGVDIDPAVLSNQDLDCATVSDGTTLPYEDELFDLVWADYVMEHVEDPAQLLSEIRRVLKPGASFFFRTPNKWHYVTTIARLTPHWFHALFANRARGLSPEAHEPYPTFYRFNSRGDVSHIVRSAGFNDTRLLFVEAEPSYMAFHPCAFLLGVAYERLVNRYEALSGMRCNIFGKLTKHGPSESSQGAQ